MKEQFKSNLLFQLFFKLTKTRAITINCVAYYRDDKKDVSLWTRLHEAFHAIEQREQGREFYIGYAKELFKAWKHREDEQQAVSFADYVLPLRTTKEHINKDNDEFVKWAYKLHN
jgi:hypothetical protein